MISDPPHKYQEPDSLNPAQINAFTGVNTCVYSYVTASLSSISCHCYQRILTSSVVQPGPVRQYTAPRDRRAHPPFATLSLPHALFVIPDPPLTPDTIYISISHCLRILMTRSTTSAPSRADSCDNRPASLGQITTGPPRLGDPQPRLIQ